MDSDFAIPMYFSSTQRDQLFPISENNNAIRVTRRTNGVDEENL